MQCVLYLTEDEICTVHTFGLAFQLEVQAMSCVPLLSLNMN